MNSPKLEIKLSHTKTPLQKDSLEYLNIIARSIRAESFFHLQKMNYISIPEIQQNRQKTWNNKHTHTKRNRQKQKTKVKAFTNFRLEKAASEL